jgi:hypothetical protein
VVNGGLAVKDHSTVIQNIDPLLPEIFTGYTLDMTEGTKIDFNIIFFS